jgi:hypothetical protein
MNNLINKKPAPVLRVEKFLNSDEPGNDENSYLEKFQRSILDQTRDYPLPVPVITINQNNELNTLLSLKSFSLWQGKQKSKKTTVLALIIAAFIRLTIFFENNFFNSSIDGVVLFFDTEQGESYAARTMRMILKLACVATSPKLVYCDLREYSPGERMQIIQAGIENTPNVKLVVIDGIVDLLTDFMDAGEGHFTITEVLKLCSLYDIHIAGVLHQNKNDKNARAHVGTIASQKCEVEISTEIDPTDRSQSIVTCVNSRGLPFEPFAIRWDKGSLPRIVDEWKACNNEDAKTTKNYNKSKEIAEAIFRPFTALAFVDAVSAIMNATMKSESTAKRNLKEFQEWGFITKGDDGNYRIKLNEGSRVHEGSNEGS